MYPNRCSRLRGITILWMAAVSMAAEGHAANRLILNEALANEPGGATSLEWVEVLNWPDTGGVVSLDGYWLIDGSDTTQFGGTQPIPAGGFAIIARRALGESSFESRWGDNSGAWGDHPAESFPLLEADISLRNSSDTLLLVGPEGDTSAILWMRDAGDGISIERIRPDRSDEPAGFGVCIDASGSTPGRQNSLFPVRADLALDSVRVTPSINGDDDSRVALAYVTNVGFGPVGSALIEAYDDRNPGVDGDTLAVIGSIQVGGLGEGESLTVEILWHNASPGRHGVIARIVADGNAANNTAMLELPIPFESPWVVVSEFLADPEIGGPDEWIEISNRADFAINMNGCAIGDSTGLSVFADTAPLMNPGEFWVLAENEAAFRAHYPEYAGNLIQVANWRSLNNTGDRIRLVGPAGEMIDSLSFRGGNGGNRSRERVDLAPILLDERYWSPSAHPDGATPGAENSVAPINHDLAIDSLFVTPSEPEWGAALRANAHYKNVGLAKFPPNFGATLYEDLNPSAPGTFLEEIARFVSSGTDSLPVGYSGLFWISWVAPTPGFHRLCIELDADDNADNNSLSVTTTVRHTEPLVIITEFLADPTPTGPGEWIELFNTADFPISMYLNRIGDSTSSSVISPFAGSIPPSGYWVLCEDEAAFTSHYPGFDGLLFEVGGWRTLGNNGDGIRLFGAAGEIIDSLTFAVTHGDNRSSERTNRDAAFSQPGDWTASVDPTGATPGRSNSVNAEDAGDFEISVAPNPFYLGRGEEAEIAYRLEIGERLTLRIFDRAGRLVRTLADDQPSATGSTTWNGTSEGGGRVDPGPYVLLARSEPEGTERKIVLVVGP